MGVVPLHHTWRSAGVARGHIAPASLGGEEKGVVIPRKGWFGMVWEVIPTGGGKGLI